MKKLSLFLSALCLTAALTVPASAAEPMTYNFSAPGDPEYGRPTSIEPVVTADRGEMPNVDASKNAALIPPGFGSPSAAASTGYTEVTDDLYYSGGYLATLKIPVIGVNVKVYEGTDTKALAKGAGHFEDTSIWEGNVAVAGHNRGTNCYFGSIHTLNMGDRITLTTKLGTRTYEVASVSKVSETDRSALAASARNMLTLYTCVRNQSSYRWCVQAMEVV